MLAYIILVLTALALFVLFKKLRNKIDNGMLLPISKLKDHSEAILKGDFEQKLEYTELDEIGEVYSMFDQMRIEMKHLNEKRDEQERAQKELISSISHDLKTPLTTVKAYIEAILDGVCPNQEAMQAYIEVMSVNTDKMTRLIDDLLLHSLRELGQVSVRPTEQYSKKVFSQILKPLSHVVQTMGITFMGPKEIPNVLVNIDVNRLEQVIANLVANALKHTSSGDSISIQIKQEEKVLRVTIADTGEGILQEDMPFIFERYYKGQTSFIQAKQKNEGNGLGLSICKYIIEAHHGTISFSSKKGQGTTFYFTLPLS
ncbi:HAMP domain-containing histidine kinase [Bacillus sp. Bva_UNVM-123]|uniref:sensor histidine kinase n=1 Tax=Bacillus sp. Bva_UNVM-123 TaxID=2829798 RepID=UPI00391F2474